MNKPTQGFTLVELLVVIAIIAILAAVVILIINPLELMKRGRDATRLKDLSNLSSAINVSLQEALTAPVTILCKESGQYPCVGRSNNEGRSTNGTGWVKADLSQKAVTVPTLPVDPINDGDYHYTYCAANLDGQDGWEINATLESDQLKSKMYSDGGNEGDRYEVGSNYFLLAATGGSCEY